MQGQKQLARVAESPFEKEDLVPKTTSIVSQMGGGWGQWGGWRLSCFPVSSSLGGTGPCGQVQGQQGREALGRGSSWLMGTPRLPGPSLCSRPGPCKEAGSKGHCPDFYCWLSSSHDPAPSAETGRTGL